MQVPNALLEQQLTWYFTQFTLLKTSHVNKNMMQSQKPKGMEKVNFCIRWFGFIGLEYHICCTPEIPNNFPGIKWTE